MSTDLPVPAIDPGSAAGFTDGISIGVVSIAVRRSCRKPVKDARRV